MDDDNTQLQQPAQAQPQQFDEEFLDSLGLSEMSPQDKQAFLLHLQEELQVRIGAVIAESLDDDQMDEFGEIIEAQDEEAAVAWLTQNYPDYQRTVFEEIDKMKQEVTENRDAILSDFVAARG